MRTRITNLVLARFAKKLFLRYYAFLVLNASNIFFCRPGISERCLVSLPYRVVATWLSGAVGPSASGGSITKV